MKTALTVLGLASTLATAATIAAGAPSPYVGQGSRPIKALAAADVQSLLDGKGMGFAKAAELNGYAGPAHVLELASELELTPEQRARTEALFASMSAQAKASGASMVEKERDLDAQFNMRTMTPERLTRLLTEIGELQARIREVHLQAHLAQVKILMPAQNARYAVLRGYASASETGHQSQH